MSDKKVLCTDCIHLKSKMVGHVSSVYWCGKKVGLGVHPWKKRPHPKCPLKGGSA